VKRKGSIKQAANLVLRLGVDLGEHEDLRKHMEQAAARYYLRLSTEEEEGGRIPLYKAVEFMEGFPGMMTYATKKLIKKGFLQEACWVYNRYHKSEGIELG